MARNGAGTYSKVNTFVAGTTITAADHNENWDDIAAEITNSLALDGQSAMTGQFKATNGTAAAPSVAFGSDTDTGLYRSGSNELSGAAGGIQVLKVNSFGIDAVSGQVLQGGAALVPTGVVVPYAGSSAPSGWLLCDGSNVSRSAYATLFAIIGTTYGVGDGTTTFNLPDLKGRSIFGREALATRITAGSGITSTALGATGGLDMLTLTTDQMPSHTHTPTVTDPGHAHHTNQTTVAAGSGLAMRDAGSSMVTSTATTGITVANSNTGGGQAHNNMPPAIILNHIIKT